jgi:cytidylate kinase
MIIAIDGPAGAGKSTVAKKVSRELNFIYLDTGAIYRAIALYLVRNNTDITNDTSIKKALTSINLKYTTEHIYLDNKIVDNELRTEEISKKTSDYSKLYLIREFATSFQRNIAINENVVLEGRDIGTVVFPDAEYKFFLTAKTEIRGKRRFEELLSKGEEASLDAIIKSIEKRDENDKEREIAPLKKAEDAVEIDTSSISIDEVVSIIISYVKSED